MYTTSSLRAVLVTLLATGLILCFGVTAYAHGDEDHTADTTVTVTHGEESEATKIARLEKILEILQKLVALHTQLQQERARAVTAISAIPAQPIADVADEHAHETSEEDTHEEGVEEHNDEAKLVIEVETHSDKTHVHVRYTDKPEAMFFVDANINDEDALVADIEETTDLTAEEIRGALKYTGM